MQESAVEFNKPVHHGKIKQIVCQTILHIIILLRCSSYSIPWCS